MKKLEKRSEKIQMVDKPEYADMCINFVEMHGANFRKPKEWYPELLYNSKKHKHAKIGTVLKNTRMDDTINSGVVLTMKFPLSKENLAKYNQALASGKGFKIFTPKDRKLKLLFDKNLKEKMKSYNKQVGFEYFSLTDGEAMLKTIDIDAGRLIIKIEIEG